MITVTRRLLTENEVRERLVVLASRYNVPVSCCDESAADQMSDFDALKWLSLCDQLKSATRRRFDSFADCAVPATLRSIYGVGEPPLSEEWENTPDKLIELAA